MPESKIIPYSQLDDSKKTSAATLLGELYPHRQAPRIDSSLKFESSHATVLGLVVENSLIAIGAVESTDGISAKIDYLIVQKEKRAKGYGGLVLKSLEDFALNLAPKRTTVIATAIKDNAVEFFKSKKYEPLHPKGVQYAKTITKTG